MVAVMLRLSKLTFSVAQKGRYGKLNNIQDRLIASRHNFRRWRVVSSGSFACVRG